ncbi:MAG TPA: hypothetical protein VJA19_02825 [Pseudomonas sp.]|nr:hypothetical protein [Pseudomonas sp.]
MFFTSAKAALLVSIFLSSSCTVVNVVGESGRIDTHWIPGIAYIRIDPGDSPLYVQHESFGVGVSNKSVTFGYGLFEQIMIKNPDDKSCLLISVSDGPTKRDFSFQKKEPEDVCKSSAFKVQN